MLLILLKKLISTININCGVCYYRISVPQVLSFQNSILLYILHICLFYQCILKAILCASELLCTYLMLHKYEL